MSTPLYIKRGSRYHPVQWHDPEAIDSLPVGAHLVIVGDCGRSTTYGIEPSHAPLLAALRQHRRRLLDVLRKASDARPARAPLTQRERRAVDAYRAIMGDEMMWLALPSASEVLDALEAALVEAAA